MEIYQAENDPQVMDNKTTILKAKNSFFENLKAFSKYFVNI